jgi:riboflavin kinase/FMN adenylyltransferase
MTQKNEPPRKLPKPVNILAAKTVSGRGRGKGLGIPTINIDLSAIPADLPHGIYACRITLSGTTYKGAMHYGPRPVFKDTPTFEVHILDATVDSVPDTADIEIVGFIRPVLDFPSPEALVKRIGQDIDEARGMLNT